MILGNLASAIFSLYIIQSYFNIYLIKTEKKLYLYLSSLLYVLFKCSCMIVDLRSTVCLVLLNVFFVFIISIGSYCGEIRNKFILTALLLIAWMIAEVIVGYILSLNQIDYRDNEFVGAIISEIFIFVIVRLIAVNRNAKTIGHLNLKIIILLMAIPISSIYLIHNIFIMSSYRENNFFPIISSILLLFINCAVFIILDKVSESVEFQRNSMLFAKQLELCDAQMKERERSEQEVRRIRHDLKAILFELKVELETGKINEAIKEIDNVIRNYQGSLITVCKSGHLVIDSLVNYKYTVAIEQKIKCDVEQHIPSNISITNTDICILIGNALDNAIEATEKLPESERLIKIFLNYTKGCFVIQIVNSFDGYLKRNGQGELITTKKNIENHGIGVLSMKKIIEKLNGDIWISQNEKLFTIKMLIYVDEL